MLQRGPDGEAGGAHPAAVGDARSVVLALPVRVLALPVLLRLEERRRVAGARPHVTALVSARAVLAELRRGVATERTRPRVPSRSSIQVMATPGVVTAAGNALLLAAHTVVAAHADAPTDAPTAPTDSRVDTQPPSTPGVVAAVAPPTDAPAVATADAPAEAPAEAPADKPVELHPPPPTAEAVAAAPDAPPEAPVAAPPPATATPGLARPARPQPQPRPRPRPRTSDGGRLTASSASAQLKANSTSLWRAAEHGDVGRLGSMPHRARTLD